MTRRLGALMGVALALGACSGRYQVGDTRDAQERVVPDEMSKTMAGSSASSLGGTSGSGGGAAVGGKSAEEERAEICESSDELEGILPPYAAPEMVWARLSQLIHGEERAAPAPLPTATTPQWARSIAEAAFEADRLDDGKVGGLEGFLEHWAELPSEPLERDWGAVASEPGATYATLIEMPHPGAPERLGIFNDRVWLTAHSQISNRARVTMRALLYEDIPGPPGGIVLISPDIGGTRRENLTAAVVETPCKACHDFLDPTGLALEHFDALGDYRTMERSKTIDASGNLQHGLVWTEEMAFKDWSDLAPRLADSCDVAVGFALRYYAYAISLMGREPAPNVILGDLRENLEEPDARRVVHAFMREGGQIASLPLAIAQTEAYLR